MVQYGLTIENRNIILQKAKEKKDGVYSFRGVVYRVQDKKVTHLAYNGEILQPFGHFNVRVGYLPDTTQSTAKKILKGLTI